MVWVNSRSGKHIALYCSNNDIIKLSSLSCWSLSSSEQQQSGVTSLRLFDFRFVFEVQPHSSPAATSLFYGTLYSCYTMDSNKTISTKTKGPLAFFFLSKSAAGTANALCGPCMCFSIWRNQQQQTEWAAFVTQL